MTKIEVATEEKQMMYDSCSPWTSSHGKLDILLSRQYVAKGEKLILVLFLYPLNKKFTKYEKNVTRVRNKAFEVVDVAKEERVWTSTPIQ